MHNNKGSLNVIVQRHEALRTIFRMREGQPVQVIAPPLHGVLAMASGIGCADTRMLAPWIGQHPSGALHHPERNKTLEGLYPTNIVYP